MVKSAFPFKDVKARTHGLPIVISRQNELNWERTGYALREIDEHEYRATNPSEKNLTRYLRNAKNR